MVKQKVIAQIYRDWGKTYNKVLKLLQVLQSCCPRTICIANLGVYYNGDIIPNTYERMTFVCECLFLFTIP
ncbi:hypothetical protein Ahy_A07g036443 [Arachis hypogaea]|uniref:Uncharacterized protein n=1 Tax=Arachis hypogaea TaxID=3818 RepID=A0A445CG77_ARAHY|nr:hypothetical protein Ahy_A07g036443 [Arachis hypogaea]